MNVKELIEKIESLPAEDYKYRPYIDKKVVLALVRQLDEPEKVKIPQFVANWIANVKRNGFKFRNSSRFYEEIVSSDDAYRVMYYILREGIAGEAIRIWVNANRDAFARAWLDSYEVEKEPKYTVKIKGVYHGDLGYAINFEGYSFYCKERSLNGIRFTHTRKELEDAGFAEVFNSPLFEVEEVTE